MGLFSALLTFRCMLGQIDGISDLSHLQISQKPQNPFTQTVFSKDPLWKWSFRLYLISC